METAMLLVQSLFALVKVFFEKEEKLDKFERTEYPIMDIAPSLLLKTKHNNLKNIIVF